MINVLITGSNGQLGNCIKDVAPSYKNLNFIFTDYTQLNIGDLNNVDAFFESQNKIHYCINCAAYTAVDKAETEIDKAYEVNALGPKNLAEVCAKNNTVLIHVSTDFVFDGTKSMPYSESDIANPISIYGKSKAQGEKHIENSFGRYFIFRTAWLYSEYGNNFMKTMLKLAETRNEISVVNDQVGTPTYARDLALVILNVIREKKESYGLYHYSNSGVASWYEFAKTIFELSNKDIKVNPIATDEYPTPAERPTYSVMDKTKIKITFNINSLYWKDSLKVALKNFK